MKKMPKAIKASGTTIDNELSIVSPVNSGQPNYNNQQRNPGITYDELLIYTEF